MKLAAWLCSTLCIGITHTQAELIAYWNMNESAGATSATAAVGGSAYDMNALGGATAGFEGKLGSAWSFDGGEETRLKLPATIPAGLTSLNPADGWTFSGWFNTLEASGVGTLFSLSLTTSGSQEAAIRVSKGKLDFLGRHNADGDASITSGIVVADGEWHHVAVTSSTIGGTTLYLNGVSVGESANSLNPSTWHAELSRYEANFGANNDNQRPAAGFESGIEWNFNGKIDEFRVYNHALTPTEINDIAWIPEPSMRSLFFFAGFCALSFRRKTLRFE